MKSHGGARSSRAQANRKLKLRRLDRKIAILDRMIELFKILPCPYFLSETQFARDAADQARKELRHQIKSSGRIT